MSLYDCVLNPTTGCTECPAVPFIPATPGHLEVSALVGWNAGATSVSFLAAAVHTVMQVAPIGGIVCGFRSSRDRNWIPELIQYGFYFQQVAGLLFASVVELGITRVPNVEVDSDAHFEIRRVGTQVIYLVDGVVFYRSTVPCTATALLVAGCLYISGDTIA